MRTQQQMPAQSAAVRGEPGTYLTGRPATAQQWLSVAIAGAATGFSVAVFATAASLPGFGIGPYTIPPIVWAPVIGGLLLALAVVALVPPQHVNKVVRGLKVVGTAAAGAAIGLAVGGPVGGIVGGIAGAIVGFFW